MKTTTSNLRRINQNGARAAQRGGAGEFLSATATTRIHLELDLDLRPTDLGVLAELAAIKGTSIEGAAKAWFESGEWSDTLFESANSFRPAD